MAFQKLPFQGNPPICPLDQSLSLNCLLFHIYCKFSSFCLCHTPLQSLPPVLCQPAETSLFPSPKQPTHHLSGWQAPVLASVSSSSESQSRKACGSPLKQPEANWSPRMVPSSLMNCSVMRWEVCFGYQSVYLDPSKAMPTGCD